MAVSFTLSDCVFSCNISQIMGAIDFYNTILIKWAQVSKVNRTSGLRLQSLSVNTPQVFFFKLTVLRFREQSWYVNSPTKNREVVANLPQSSDVGGISAVPMYASALPFALAITRLCQVICKLCKSRSNQVNVEVHI